MSAWDIVTVDGTEPGLLEAARTLFAEYHEWLGEVVCSRTMAQEIAALPGVYAAPTGRLLLALGSDGAARGIVGVRPFNGGQSEAELKRLYVRPDARGAGLGRALARAALDAASELGYSEALLTTLPDSMAAALSLYRELGFSDSEPFYDHSHVDPDTPIAFMRKRLSA